MDGNSSGLYLMVKFSISSFEFLGSAMHSAVISCREAVAQKFSKIIKWH
jgi:hypothetical protein